MWRKVKQEPKDIVEMELERSDKDEEAVFERGAVGGVQVKTEPGEKRRISTSEVVYVDDEEYNYSDVRLAEKKEWVRRAKSLGFDGDKTSNASISSLATACRTGLLGDVPDPVTAGIFEQMERKVCVCGDHENNAIRKRFEFFEYYSIAVVVSQTGLDLEGLEIIPGDEAVDSEGCESDLSDTEAIREEAFQDDALRVAAHLGLLDPTTKVLTEDQAKRIQERIDMRELCKGYGLLAKASRVQAKGFAMISSVLARNPAMSILSASLEGFQGGNNQSTQSQSQSGQPSSQLYKPVPVVQPGPIKGPMKIPGEKGFFCRFCKDNFNTWETADSHTRRFHTGDFYVCGCGEYKTPNRAVLRTHRRTCVALKGKSEVKEEKVEGLSDSV